MDRYVCIHGHFYQPPRENPWLEAIEVQDSAYPYHDWNERITAECYAPNATSRLLDSEGFIAEIVNNYARISFDFGPTLLSWLEQHAPRVYQAIQQADRAAAERFSGHGAALAQAYGHMIMPLANERDRQTQVIWGMRDFEHRFGRTPEGMWLPETAADIATLEALAEAGIAFTILAPRQARRTRPLGGRNWTDVSDERIDPARAYLQRLPSGRSIALFFYSGAISKAVAFEGLLDSGDAFAARLVGGFADGQEWPQLVNIATDGESYGHHHRFGDMALAAALQHIESSDQAQLTVYGEYLEKHPPAYEVQILENTSWSCEHGIQRWRADCGCNSGRHPGWRQHWRGPLRAAFDWLRDTLALEYEAEAGRLLRDPWAARDGYIDVVLDRSRENVDRFLTKHASRPLDDAEVVRALKLLELQRHAMLMYTSCGWFFDDVSGIETVQVVEYADRVLQLGEELFGEDISAGFLSRLSRARSNDPAHGNGRTIYEKWVRPSRIGLVEVGAHHAVSSLFDKCGERVYAYNVAADDCSLGEKGRARLAVGSARVTSRVTLESSDISYGALLQGNHNVSAGARLRGDEEEEREAARTLKEAFTNGDFPAVARHIERSFGAPTCSIRSLFLDEQREVLDGILNSALEGVEAVYSTIYEREAPMMRFLNVLDTPVPKAFRNAAELFIDRSLRRAVRADGAPDLETILGLVEEASATGADLDVEGIGYELGRALGRVADRLGADPYQLGALEDMLKIVDLARNGPFPVDLTEAQNLCCELARTAFPDAQTAARGGDATKADWTERLAALARDLRIRVPD